MLFWASQFGVLKFYAVVVTASYKLRKKLCIGRPIAAVVKDIANGAGGLGFDSRVGK